MALAASSQGEDVLLSEARIISEAHEPWQPPPRSFPTGNFDPRTAIFRAREAYRERVRAKTAAERQSAGAEAMVGSPGVEDFASPIAEQPTPEPVDRLPDEVGPTAAAELPMQVADADPWVSDSLEAESLVVQPALPVAEAAREEGFAEDPLTIASEFHLGGLDAEWRAPARRDEQAVVPVATTASNEEANSTRIRVEQSEKDALPDWYRADLPRVCRTCRDYRPAAEGQRGWCANSWAFTHRRLVLEDDPAPCQSAIGDWWLPVDDVWLVAADVSSHGRATPLLDRLTGKADRQRRRS